MAATTELTEASDAAEQSAALAITTYLKERFPLLIVDGGPASDLIVAPAAAVLASVRVEADAAVTSVEDQLRAGTDPDELTDELAAIGVTRELAAKATGTLRLSYTADASSVISSSAIFTTTDGVEYAPTGAYQVLTTGATPTGANNEVQLVLYGTRYVVTIDVTAVTAGSNGNKPAGTVLTVPTSFAENTVSYLATNATGGRDDEDAAALLAKVEDIYEPATTATNAGIRNLVRTVDATLTTTIVGFGHAGLKRSSVGAGVSVPGRADVYIREAAALGRVYTTVTATLIEDVSGVGRWQFTTDAIAGAWYPERAYPEGLEGTESGYAVTFASRGYDATTTHDIVEVQDAAGSAYATITGRFLDPDTDISGLTVGADTQDYTVAIRVGNLVEDVQTELDSDDASAAGSDVLARAPTPVQVFATITVFYPTGLTVDEDAIAAAFAAAVNSTGIDTTLYGTQAAAAAVLAAPTGSRVVVTSISGVIYGWAVATGSVTGTDSLTLTADTDNGVGADTAAFYCDAANVTVQTTAI